MPTLRNALLETDHNRWKGTRTRGRSFCQAQKGVDTLEDLTAPGISVESIQQHHVRKAVAIWLAAGLKASTVVARLNCLSATPRKLKWWLSPQEQAALLPWLRAHAPSAPKKNTAPVSVPVEIKLAKQVGKFDFITVTGLPMPEGRPSSKQHFPLLADYIEWATIVGCRVEETLRLEWRDVHVRGGRTLITVPGLKTCFAQATLPIPEEAAAILRRRKEAGEAKPFDISYPALLYAWKEARLFLGHAEPHKATLKALRRNAARSLHVSKGMPLDMVRQYLRHENVDTTLGYLRLTGGYGEDEMARFL